MSSLIKTNLFLSKEFKEAKNILFFMSLEKEIQTWEMICQCLEIGKKVYLPVTVKNSSDLKIVPLLNKDIDLVSGTYGIKKPRKINYDYVDLNQINLVIVPGLAFDYQGSRLGYGKGYYDRLFAKGNPKMLRFGVALDFQILDCVPKSKNDLPVNLIATEKRVLFCNPNNMLGPYK